MGDAVASEMIKQVPVEKIHTFTMYFQERFMGQMETSSSWKIVNWCFCGNLMRSQIKECEVMEPLI